MPTNKTVADPTYTVSVFIVDDGPTFDVFERWGVPPHTTGKLTRYGAKWPPGEYTQLTLPTQLIPRLVESISDPQVQADLLACIGGSKTSATAEG